MAPVIIFFQGKLKISTHKYPIIFNLRAAPSTQLIKINVLPARSVWPFCFPTPRAAFSFTENPICIRFTGMFGCMKKGGYCRVCKSLRRQETNDESIENSLEPKLWPKLRLECAGLNFDRAQLARLNLRFASLISTDENEGESHSSSAWAEMINRANIVGADWHTLYFSLHVLAAGASQFYQKFDCAGRKKFSLFTASMLAF